MDKSLHHIPTLQLRKITRGHDREWAPPLYQPGRAADRKNEASLISVKRREKSHVELWVEHQLADPPTPLPPPTPTRKTPPRPIVSNSKAPRVSADSELPTLQPTVYRPVAPLLQSRTNDSRALDDPTLQPTVYKPAAPVLQRSFNDSYTPEELLQPTVYNPFSTAATKDNDAITQPVSVHDLVATIKKAANGGSPYIDQPASLTPHSVRKPKPQPLLAGKPLNPPKSPKKPALVSPRTQRKQALEFLKKRTKDRQMALRKPEANANASKLTMPAIAHAREFLGNWHYHEKQQQQGNVGGNDGDMKLPVHMFLQDEPKKSKDYFLPNCDQDRQRHFELALRALEGDVPELPQDKESYHEWQQNNPKLANEFGTKLPWFLAAKK
jgi:hypothetical protein